MGLQRLNSYPTAFELYGESFLKGGSRQTHLTNEGFVLLLKQEKSVQACWL